MSSPLSEMKHVVIVGNTNAGKSSLINALLEQEVAIVSGKPGTTTDPVTRKMEMGALGAIALVDTAGLGDGTELGAIRETKSKNRLAKADLVLLVSPQHRVPSPEEKQLLDYLEEKRLPFLVVLSHADKEPNGRKTALFAPYKPITVDLSKGLGLRVLKKRLQSLASDAPEEITPLEGLVQEGDLVLLVTPIDLASPKGRLILPQVETIRDALDRDCSTLVVKERELYHLYHNLGIKPKLVITDSQEFSKVAADLPPDQPLTSFSILFARKKGDMEQFFQGLRAMEALGGQPKVLIMESCKHHRQADDIGTVKIPRLFSQMVNAEVQFDFTRDMDTLPDLSHYDLIIHCGSCMLTRKSMQVRLEEIRIAGTPVLNYGLFLAWANGLLPRAIEPLPEVMGLWAQKPIP
jgi:[FeFe] hydrogenase H-cluster maturation GTPase HydF